MKKFCQTLLTATVVAAAPTLWAQEQKDSPPAGQGQQRLFERIDANKDGQLTSDEISDEQKRLFQRLLRTSDKNQDGKISQEEFAEGSRERPRRPAEEGDNPGQPRPGANVDPGELFRNLDKNGDGKLVADEVPEDRRERFQSGLAITDKNSDGGLNLEEFRAAMATMAAAAGRPGDGGRPGEPGRPNPANSPLFRAIDANSDGKLSAEELASAADALKKLDKNSDGFVTPSELAPPGAPQGNRGQAAVGAEAFRARLMQADANSDGKLSKDEAPGRMKESFDRLDSNSDGFLDKAEIDAMLQRFQRPRNPGNDENPRRRRSTSENSEKTNQ